VIGTFRYDDEGRLAEEWVQTDYRGFLTKLGVTTTETAHGQSANRSPVGDWECRRRLRDWFRGPRVTRAQRSARALAASCPVDPNGAQPGSSEAALAALPTPSAPSTMRRSAGLLPRWLAALRGYSEALPVLHPQLVAADPAAAVRGNPRPIAYATYAGLPEGALRAGRAVFLIPLIMSGCAEMPATRQRR
jgi:hypothetical protein